MMGYIGILFSTVVSSKCTILVTRNINLGILNPYFKTTLQPWLVWLSRLSMGCEPKGRWFNSQSGHTPGSWARSPVGGPREATTH